jgi:hypothetical protein
VIPRPNTQALLTLLAGRSRHDAGDDFVRLAVRLRAGDACEYCLLPTVGQFHVDHVIPPARWPDYVSGRLRALSPRPGRQGPQHIDNFAWCCPFCNGAKQQQVTRRIARRTHRLFDPRCDHWPEHFAYFHNHLIIVGVTGIGRATTEALGFNTGGPQGPLGSRHDAILASRYPPPWARGWPTVGVR